MSPVTFHRARWLLLVLLCGAAVVTPANGAPAIDGTSISPTAILVGIETPVTVTAVITDDSVIAGSVYVQRMDSGGRVLATLGTMRDDGQNGDAAAGDKTLTLRLTFTESMVGPIYLRVSAAFRGVLLRVNSAAIILNVDASTSLRITAVPDKLPNAAGWNNTNVIVSFICSGGIDPVTCATPVTVSDEGQNQRVSGTALDAAGNIATASVSINLDRTSPLVSIVSPINSATVFVSPMSVTGTVTDALSGVTGVSCNALPGILTDVGIACSVSLVSGSNAVAVTTTDAAGNETTSTVTAHYVAAPQVALTTPPNLSYFNISPTTVTGNVNDPTAIVTVNSIPAAVINGRFSVALPLAEGPNIITATASSAGGAVGTTSIEVTLDTTPPHVTITSPPDGFVTTDASISVAGNVNDIVVGTVNDQQAQVTVNSISSQVANRTFLATNVPLAMGANQVQAIGRDRVGNFVTTQITVTRQPQTGSQIRLISGNNQGGAIGSVLSAALVVGLADSVGNAVPNKSVIFKVTQNDGMVSDGGPAAATLITTTNGQGQAQVRWTLGMRAGAGGNVVEAYSVGLNGTAIFTATGIQGPPGRIVVDTGGDQIGAVGQELPKPLIAVVVDTGNNRLAGIPVTFSMKEGGGSFNGQPTFTVISDSDGRAAATLTLGREEGNGNNVTEATFPSNQGFPATFTSSGRSPGNSLNTRISGVVLDNSNVPIPGVTIRAVLTNLLHSNVGSILTAPSATTDAQGQFLIAQAPVGFVKLIVDGSTAQRPGVYPSLEYDMVTVAGQNNIVGGPIYILPLKTSNQLCVTASAGGGTLTIPEAPEFSLTFGPGQVTFPGGSKTGCISVTVVHGDRVPMVPGFGQQPRFIVTIQPSGALFNPPAPITLPNVDGLNPRSVTEMYSYDHDISSFVAIGTAIVSDDGRLIRSSAGVGVLKSGWHCGGNPIPPASTGSIRLSVSPKGPIRLQPRKGIPKLKVTAVGSPAPDGHYEWTLRTKNPQNLAPAKIVESPEEQKCASRATCLITLESVNAGAATLDVVYISDITGARSETKSLEVMTDDALLVYLRGGGLVAGGEGFLHLDHPPDLATLSLLTNDFPGAVVYSVGAGTPSEQHAVAKQIVDENEWPDAPNTHIILIGYSAGGFVAITSGIPALRVITIDSIATNAAGLPVISDPTTGIPIVSNDQSTESVTSPNGSRVFNYFQDSGDSHSILDRRVFGFLEGLRVSNGNNLQATRDAQFTGLGHGNIFELLYLNEPADSCIRQALGDTTKSCSLTSRWR